MTTDYSNIAAEIMDAPEPITLKAGTEVNLRIISVRTGTSEKSGIDYFSPNFEVIDEPMVQEFSWFAWDPKDNTKMDPKTRARNNFSLKNFFLAFGIDISRPLNLSEDLIGAKGWAIVGVKKSEEYGEQNTIKKFILPR